MESEGASADWSTIPPAIRARILSHLELRDVLSYARTSREAVQDTPVPRIEHRHQLRRSVCYANLMLKRVDPDLGCLLRGDELCVFVRGERSDAVWISFDPFCESTRSFVWHECPMWGSYGVVRRILSNLYGSAYLEESDLAYCMIASAEE